ncbi:MAG TPA: AraC family transcriptional regulator [Vicinamibacterales bacterium]
MAKIAVNLKRQQARPVDEPGDLDINVVAEGDGWTVEDVVCSRGPRDRRFEEQHDTFVIAIVTSGTFQYRSSGANSEVMMTPGSVLLGNPGQCFECGHEHGAGDRCLAFHFAADYFHTIAEGSDPGRVLRSFRAPKLSAVQTLSPIVTDACAALAGSRQVAWEELGVRLAARAFQMDGESKGARSATSPAAIARITESVRLIEAHQGSELTLVRLAKEAHLSPFHFLRTFEAVTGTTPHRYMRRMRLRAAAVRLSSSETKIVDVAFESGFGDVSNFNRAFRAEFGVTPTTYRLRHR